MCTIHSTFPLSDCELAETHNETCLLQIRRTITPHTQQIVCQDVSSNGADSSPSIFGKDAASCPPFSGADAQGEAAVESKLPAPLSKDLGSSPPTSLGYSKLRVCNPMNNQRQLQTPTRERNGISGSGLVVLFLIEVLECPHVSS
eukprot:1638928-Amphidinium_carterae.3